MSSGHFHRTNNRKSREELHSTKTPNTSETVTPLNSQINSTSESQSYVYRPPTKIVRTNKVPTQQTLKTDRSKKEKPKAPITQKSEEQEVKPLNKPIVRQPINRSGIKVQEQKKVASKTPSKQTQSNVAIKSQSQPYLTKRGPGIPKQSNILKTEQSESIKTEQQQTPQFNPVSPQRSVASPAAFNSPSVHGSSSKINQFEVVDQNESSSSTIKSNLLIHALNRLYKNKVQAHFDRLVQRSINAGIETSRHGKVMCDTIHKISVSYQNNYLLGGAFHKIVILPSISIYRQKITQTTNVKHLEHAKSVSHNFFSSILKNVHQGRQYQKDLMYRLALNKIVKSNVLKSLVRSLDGLQKRKLRESFLQFRVNILMQNSVKKYRLGNVPVLINKVQKSSLAESFHKIALFDIKAQLKALPQSSVIIHQTSSKFDSTKDEAGSLEEEIYRLQEEIRHKTVQKKRSVDSQFKELNSNLESLKAENSSLEQGHVQQKQLNSELKQKLSKIQKAFQERSSLGSSAVTSLPGTSEEQLLGILHEIYMEVYRLSAHSGAQTEEPDANSQFQMLYSIHKVDKKLKEKELVKKWVQINKRQQLHSQINAYEKIHIGSGEQSRGNSAQQVLHDENKTIEKFIRSYIKERYMWQEIKGYVTAAIE